MSLLFRGTRQPALATTLAPTASFRPYARSAGRHRTYADSKSNAAQPKILNDSPPDENNAPQDVKEHNKEVDKRADRPQEKVKGDDVEKDKVPKGYWGGSE